MKIIVDWCAFLRLCQRRCRYKLKSRETTHIHTSNTSREFFLVVKQELDEWRREIEALVHLVFDFDLCRFLKKRNDLMINEITLQNIFVINKKLAHFF